VLTLLNFVAALIVSWAVVYAIYGLTLLVVHSVWRAVRVASWLIAHASLGVTLVVVPAVWWMVRAFGRLGAGTRIRSALADSTVAPTVASTVGSRGDVLTPTMRRPTFPEVAVSISEASEALTKYQGRVFWARSEMRETVARTLNAIAQTRALMAEVDAAAGPQRQAARRTTVLPG
jgi:hypothetical protein